MKKPGMKKRKIGIALAVAALLLAGCGGGGGSANSGNSSGNGKAGSSGSVSGTVVVGTWGGDYEHFQQQSVVPALQKVDPNLKVVFDTADAPPREAKLEAEKSGTSTYDVVHFDNATMQKMIDQNLLLKLDYSKMPNASHIVNQRFKNPYWIPHIFSADGILYNTQKVSPAPTSLAVFWNPKYAGKIGVLTTDWDSWVYAAAAYHDKGNPGTNWDVGWPDLKKLAGKVQVFPSQEQLGAALKSGQIWLTFDWKARYYQWKQAGAPIAYALPKETTFPIIFAAAIPKNAPDKAAGYAYLNAMLAPTAQKYFASHMGYSPTVDNSGISSTLQSAIGFTASENKLIIPWNDKYVAQNDSKWQKEWQQYILAK